MPYLSYCWFTLYVAFLRWGGCALFSLLIFVVFKTLKGNETKTTLFVRAVPGKRAFLSYGVARSEIQRFQQQQ